MIRSTVKFLLLAEAFAVATFAFGWWAVPVLAFAWAFLVSSNRPVLFATICAMAAWCGVLLLDAVRGPLDAVAERFGGITGFAPLALLATTILFPTLLAWSASTVGVALRRATISRRAEPQQPPGVATEPRPNAREVMVVDA